MVMNQNNQILLVESFTRGWEFPGGYVEKEESLKAAAIREVKEESGIDIQITGFYGIEQNIRNSTCIIIFEGKVIGGKLTHSEENLSAGYFSVKKAEKMITNDSFRQRMQRCLHNNDHPFIYIIE